MTEICDSSSVYCFPKRISENFVTEHQLIIERVKNNYLPPQDYCLLGLKHPEDLS